MSSTERPKSYDELTRQLVPLPDSSHRPSADEARRAETPPAPTVASAGGGADVQAGVRAAMAGLAQIDLADVTVAVTSGTATIVGSVARGLDRDAIVEALRRVPGIVTVIDQLRIRTE